MGKGDIKTRRGKFFAGSFGKRRPKHKTKTRNVTKVPPVITEQTAPRPAPRAAEAKTSTVEKPAPRKAPAKKTESQEDKGKDEATA